MNNVDGVQVFNGREPLKNKCNNGHFSQVFARYCSVCGEPIERRFSYHDWAGLTFNMQEHWRHLTDWREQSDTVYFSYFDERLLLLSKSNLALYVESVFPNSDTNCRARNFALGSVQDIEQVLAIDGEIFLLANGSIWKINWLDLINQVYDPQNIPTPSNDYKKLLVYSGKIYAVSTDHLFDVAGNQPLFRLPANERLLDVEAKGSRLCVVSQDMNRSTEDKITLNVRTQHRADPAKLCEPVPFTYQPEQELRCHSACGKDYYAISLGDQRVRIGKYSSLQANRVMMYDVDTGNEVERLFFLHNNLYVYGQHHLKTWDCASFTNNPKGSLNGVNLATMKASTSETDKKILLPIQQVQDDYIAVYNTNLSQQSISWGFNEKLVAMDVLDNHVFALFRSDGILKLYLG